MFDFLLTLEILLMRLASPKSSLLTGLDLVED
jgi:hypothetical protein